MSKCNYKLTLIKLKMPEGPEIHREADKIRDAIGNQPCRYAYFYHDHLKPFEKELVGSTFNSVEAHGKGMVIEIEGGHYFYSHNQLYGKWYIKPAGEYPDTNRELRAELRTDLNSALLYSASEIEIMDKESLNEHSYLTKLGPDVLRDVTPELIAERAGSDQFNGRSFAALLLDQQFLGGVGNYLRTEILFHSGVHPKDRPKDLTDEELLEFGKSVLTISHRSYESGGITVDDESLRTAKSRGEKRKTHRYYLFGREDDDCRVCGSTIVKKKISGRRIYICSNCQNR